MEKYGLSPTFEKGGAKSIVFFVWVLFGFCLGFVWVLFGFYYVIYPRFYLKFLLHFS